MWNFIEELINYFFFFYYIFKKQFRDILKPAYNDIDITEVELMDDDKPIREFGTFLLNVSFIE